jgi:hypothetical protein
MVSNSCKRSSGIGGAESAALFFCSRVKASLGGDSAFLSSSRGRLCHGPWTCLGVDSGRLGSRINALGGGGGGGSEGDGVVQARATRGIIQPV